MGYRKGKVDLLATSLAIFFTVLVAGLYYVWPQPFEYIDWKIYDFKLSLKKPTKLHPDIVHLDVDDKAATKFGLWPWDRKISAQIVTRLSELGAAVVVFDIMFTAGGITSEGNEELFKAISAAGNVVSASAFGIDEKPGDKIRIEGDQERAKAYYSRAWRVRLPQELRFYRVGRVSDALLPLIPVIENSKFVGHIRAMPDRDGVHRRIPVIVGFWDRIIPSLSLAALVAYWKITPERVKIDEHGHLSLPHAGGMLEIPLDADGTMFINWQRRWNDFDHASVNCLFDEKSEAVRSEFFRNKIVIIGHSGTGTTEIGVNPFSNNCILSRVHSSVLNAILTRSFITKVTGYSYFPIFAAVVSILFTLGALRLHLLYGIVLAIGASILYIIIVFLLFTHYSLEVPLSAPLSVFAAATSSALTYYGISLERKADKISQVLGRYLSPEMLSSITAQDFDVRTSVKREELTILFADVAGFSTMSETVDVEYLREFLNDFFEAITRAVFDNKGTVDKFLGDGLMAFFGDPVKVENHALAAIETARQMHREVEKLNLKWKRSAIREFENGIRIRIGINTGMVMVGSVGSERRMDYTAIGSAVNIASRLEQEAPPGGILVSARTVALAGNQLQCGSPKAIKIRGVEKPISVCEL